jgi:hypothetical protein
MCAHDDQERNDMKSGGYFFSLRWLSVGAMLMTLIIVGCARGSDEKALREAMEQMEIALEAGETGDFLDYVTEDFSGNSAELNAAQLRGTLVGLKLRHEKLGVTLGPAAIKLFGDRATINVQILATGGTWMPETGQILDIESSWRREGGDWKCFAARWSGKW